ncbi:MAG TPA: hypothetical protein VL961_00860 [Acidimicrobiales bacterium]|nr:hypothetical protein [Acidimicrobiales bacterium]
MAIPEDTAAPESKGAPESGVMPEPGVMPESGSALPDSVNHESAVIEEARRSLVATADPALTEEPPAPAAAPDPARVRVTIPARASSFWRDNKHGLAIALVGTVALRVVTEWVALVSQYGVRFPHLVARQPNLLFGVWAHWDVGYYESIAQYGYAGRTVGHGQAAGSIAFAPLYPLGIRLVHVVTHLGYNASAELLSAGALFVAVAALHRTIVQARSRPVAATSIFVLLAFPTSFFLLAPYPEALGLALVTLTFMAVRRRQWLLAGLLAAAATMTKYYLAVIVVALVYEVWERRRERARNGEALGTWEHEAIRASAVTIPTLGAMGLWMVYQQNHIGDAYAFLHAQERQWHRHLAAPWTLFHRTISDLVHWRFLDTSTASVTELFDFVTVIILAVVALYVFLRVRRSYGILLGLCWCVYTFQTYLLGVTREVLVLFPLFFGVGLWASRSPWRERALMVLMIPCAYFLIQRYVTGAFAG